MSKAKYKRVMLKLGGEALAGPGGYGIDPERAEEVATKIHRVKEHDVEIAIVMGAGNLWRGKGGLAHGMEQATADHMGMLATVMNSLALHDALERTGITTRVQTAVEMRAFAEPYIRLRTTRHLEKGRVVILGAGTGNPFFTTDTAAALRAIEIGAEVLIKATKVDGVYDSDPMKTKGAKRFDRLSYLDVLRKNLKVMDATAISLCRDNNLPIIVFNIMTKGNVKKAVMGEKIGTIVEHKI